MLLCLCHHIEYVPNALLRGVMGDEKERAMQIECVRKHSLSLHTHTHIRPTDDSDARGASYAREAREHTHTLVNIRICHDSFDKSLSSPLILIVPRLYVFSFTTCTYATGIRLSVALDSTPARSNVISTFSPCGKGFCSALFFVKI